MKDKKFKVEAIRMFADEEEEWLEQLPGHQFVPVIKTWFPHSMLGMVILRVTHLPTRLHREAKLVGVQRKVMMAEYGGAQRSLTATIKLLKEELSAKNKRPG